MASPRILSAARDLPAEPTSFVGRRAEVAELKRVLGVSRLVTLTGPGGVGKTRLAMRVAVDTAARYRDGVVLVELANVDDPRLVVETVGAALGMHGEASQWSATTLVDYLTGQRLLLILDNCEHVVEPAASLAGTLLRACPDLKILATSRQALGIGGETVTRVLPMSVADVADGAPVGPRSDAVELFLERAGSADRTPGHGDRWDLTFDARTGPLILELCRRLDGIPLALELAAVRARTLGLEGVLAGLDGSTLDLGPGDRMAPERQRTLENAIDWSYRLLGEPERLLWQRLSVFAGGFELDAAQRVCADDEVPAESIPGLVAALVERSLVARETRGGRARFRILEVLRTVARDRLGATGAGAIVARRHAAWVSVLGADVATNDGRQAELFARARAERANVWAALRFCAGSADDATLGISICRDLWAFWQCARPVSEIVRVLEDLIDLVPDGTRIQATGLWVAAALHAVQRDLESADRMALRALELGRRLGDAEVVEWSLLARCHRLWYEDRWAESEAVGIEAYGLATAMEMPFATLVALYSVASAKLLGGDTDGAEEAANRAVVLSERLGETWLRAYVLNFIGHIRLQRGDPSEAERLARACLALRRDLGDGVGVRHSLELLVLVAAAREQWDRAATFLGAADSVWRAIAGRAVRLTTAADQLAAQEVRAALGGDAFDAAYGRGLGLTADEAIDMGLGVMRRVEPRTSRHVPSVLSPRELEVARLVADGASNSETAARLFISERTVETHVASIFNKLGLESRVQVARWLAMQEAVET